MKHDKEKARQEGDALARKKKTGKCWPRVHPNILLTSSISIYLYVMVPKESLQIPIALAGEQLLFALTWPLGYRDAFQYKKIKIWRFQCKTPGFPLQTFRPSSVKLQRFFSLPSHQQLPAATSSYQQLPAATSSYYHPRRVKENDTPTVEYLVF